MIKKYLRYQMLKWLPNYFARKVHRYELKHQVSLNENRDDQSDEYLELAHLGTDEILGGPFKGMKYSGQAICSTKAPKILGSYEAELTEYIKALILKNPKKIINIGAAEGYYAIGMALKVPDAEILAIDPSPRSRTSIFLNAELNNVNERFRFHFWMSFSQIRKEIIKDKTFLIVDYEGSEIGYLNLKRIPELKFASFLVETHDFVYPTISDDLYSRFKGTHDLVIVNQDKRNQDDYPLLNKVEPELAQKIMSEKRPRSIKWLLGIPKSWDKNES